MQKHRHWSWLAAVALIASPAWATDDSMTQTGDEAGAMGHEHAEGDQAGRIDDKASDPAMVMEDDSLVDEPGTVDTAGRSETEPPRREREEGVYSSSLVVTPQGGVLGFADATDEYDSRFVTGITLDWNAVPGLSDLTSGRLGLSTGFMASHIGSPQANFVGNSDPGEINTGANFWAVPIQFNGGVNLSDAIAVTARVGTHLLHRSQNSSMLIGREDFSGDSSTEFLPSAGLEAGFALGKSIGISLRGDYIPTPRQDLFTATLGAAIPLG